MSMEAEQEAVETGRDTADTRYALIEQAIAELRPRLKMDGGDCELVSVEGNLVTVRLTGACVGCQLAGATINGIQARLIEKLGFLVRVAAAAPGPSRPVQIRRPN